MDCLKNYIGLIGCSESIPESGLFINELPGISFESIEKLSDQEQANYIGVWNDVEKRGLKKFNTALTSYFKQRWKLKKLVDRVQIGKLFDSAKIIPKDPGTSRGIIITLQPYQTEPNYSELLNLILTEIYFISSNDASDVKFSISDFETSEELWSETFSFVANEPKKILAHFSAPALKFPRKLMIIYDSSDVDSLQTNLNPFSGYDDDWPCCSCCVEDCCDAIIEGFTIDASGEMIKQSNNSHGIRGFISLGCSYDGLVCASKEIFSTALWYLLGAEMMIERMHSPRLNRFTTIDLKKAKDLHESFVAQYQEEIQLIVDGIDLNDDNCCLEANPLVGYVEVDL
jgi:hypothetical protein